MDAFEKPTKDLMNAIDFKSFSTQKRVRVAFEHAIIDLEAVYISPSQSEAITSCKGTQDNSIT